jgi:uncharacterized protein YwlG (UPF0340 family)
MALCITADIGLSVGRRLMGMHNQVHMLPKNSLRRIKRVGVTATSFAATIWLLALVWIW